MAEPSQGATQALEEHTAGDPKAASRLMPLVYDELRALAARYMRGERADHSLQPTALVHEAYIRLIDISRIDWQGKTHFVAMAATQMRRILVEHARARRAQKRGGAPKRVSLDEKIAFIPGNTLDLLVLDEALEKLAGASPRQSRVAELRCFAGLNTKETAYILGVSERTARQDWLVARAWLLREIGPKSGRP
jgi:RNA polymerase sigma factor (TIGR02999 family)